WLTDEMERQAMAIIEEIRRMGGVVRAIEEGYFLREIADASYRFQQEVERGERIIVGVNAFQDEGLQVPIQLIDPKVEQVQAERLARVRRERDPKRVQEALAGLRRAAVEGQNTMPHFVECALAYCTLGEMMDELRAVYGVYEEPVLV
ncbi:MAG: methylmalonyl-CoA mutase family protein, partial [Meiothermus sp.]